MGVKVEEQWCYKKVKSEAASRSAFCFKINRKLKQEAKTRMSYGYGNITGYSREVIVKITGGARSKKGIKNAIEYISKDWQEEVVDSNGIKYRTKEEMDDAIKILQENVITNTKGERIGEKLTHNMMFSASVLAAVKKEDMLQAASEVLKEKYYDNYFVYTYHDDTKKPHVHVVLNIHRDNGKKIDIRNKDFHEIRREFCQKLIKQGYNLKASRRYENGKYNLGEEDHEELRKGNRNIYEVKEFGTESYKIDKSNDRNSYLIYKTANNREVVIWGKEILNELIDKNIKKGDLITIKKTGQVDIKVPVYDSDGATIISWKTAKRNNWKIEKAENNIDSIKIKYQKEIKLDNLEQAMKQLKQKEKFNHEKERLLDSLDKKKFKLESKLTHKQQKWGLNF